MMGASFVAASLEAGPEYVGHVSTVCKWVRDRLQKPNAFSKIPAALERAFLDCFGCTTELHSAHCHGCLQFATNVFMVPYFALRISPGAAPGPALQAPKSPVPGVKWPTFTQLFAWPAIVVTAISAVWLVAARPEMGGSLADRWAYLLHAAQSDRAFAAFLSDMVLYSIWQFVLMRDAPGLYRRIPYFGILAWYLDFRRPALEPEPS